MGMGKPLAEVPTGSALAVAKKPAAGSFPCGSSASAIQQVAGGSLAPLWAQSVLPVGPHSPVRS